MGDFDDVKDGLRTAQDAALSAIAALGDARGEIDGVRGALQVTLKGAMNPRAASAKAGLDQAAEACDELVALLRDGSGKFDDYIGSM